MEMPNGFDFTTLEKGSGEHDLAVERLRLMHALHQTLINETSFEVDIIERKFKIHNPVYEATGQAGSTNGLAKAVAHAYGSLLLMGIGTMMGVDPSDYRNRK